MASFVACAILLPVLSACSSDADATIPKFDASTLCKEVTTDTSLPECTSGFTDGAAIRLPQEINSSGFFGVIGSASGSTVAIIDANSDSHELSEEIQSKLIEEHSVSSNNGSYANTIFYAALNDGVVKMLTPAATITTEVIMQSVYAGAVFEGTISTWLGDGYDLDPSLPIQIRFESQASKIGDAVGIKGVITNAEQAVTLSSGNEAPSLSVNGISDPLQDSFTANVSIQRFPSMHSDYDDELVLAWNDSSSGMGAEFYPSAAAAAGVETIDGSWSVSQHGSPTAGPALLLTRTN